MTTHEVLNQPPPLVDLDLFQADPALREAVHRGGTGAAAAALGEIGRLAGSAEAAESGRLANGHPPELRTHDRFGHRIDEVEFHPAWHELMALGDRRTSCTTCPGASRGAGAHVARAALLSLLVARSRPGTAARSR